MSLFDRCDLEPEPADEGPRFPPSGSISLTPATFRGLPETMRRGDNTIRPEVCLGGSWRPVKFV